MIIGRTDSSLGEVFFTYMPAWEMFFSMHVLARPEHHESRKRWVEEKEQSFPNIVEDIRKWRYLTMDWNMIIDSFLWSEFRQMEIEELLIELHKRNIYQWNEIVACTGIEWSIKERDTILDLLERYYKEVYKTEELFIRPGLIRVLRRELERCEKVGLTKWAKEIHSRLYVCDESISYIKDKEYRYPQKEIRAIYVTVSTFVDPHLWMCQTPGELEIIKRLPMEEVKGEIPDDFAVLFKALSDETRLKIVKCLLKGISTTQEISQRLEISEAAVSKHLKLLYEAELVVKRKNGYFVEYEFQTEKINYLPYLFYETMRI